jgi:hypothetical protein
MRVGICGIDNHSGTSCDSVTGGLPTIISEVYSWFHNRDLDCFRLLEEWNPVQKNPQQTLTFSTFGSPPDLWGSSML